MSDELPAIVIRDGMRPVLLGCEDWRDFPCRHVRSFAQDGQRQIELGPPFCQGHDRALVSSPDHQIGFPIFPPRDRVSTTAGRSEISTLSGMRPRYSLLP